MRFLCLAYGDEKDWMALTTSEQDELLAQDEVLRRGGALVAVLGGATTVRTWNETAPRTDTPYAESAAPLVGFSLIEAADLDEAVALVAQTPCAVAKGAVEVHPLLEG